MAKIGHRSEHHGAFSDVADPFLGRGELIEGTTMGQQCGRS